MANLYEFLQCESYRNLHLVDKSSPTPKAVLSMAQKQTAPQRPNEIV